MKLTRTRGKSALQRNRQDPAFGRGERKRQHALDRKHPQSPLSKLKLREQLKIISPPKKQGAKLHSRVAETKPSPLLRRINLERSRRLYFSTSCQTPFQSLPGGFRRKS